MFVHVFQYPISNLLQTSYFSQAVKFKFYFRYFACCKEYICVPRIQLAMEYEYLRNIHVLIFAKSS